MVEILVEKVLDRSKYPGAVIFVDKEGNVCRAERRKPLSEEEKKKRAEERKASKQKRSKENTEWQKKWSAKHKECKRYLIKEDLSGYKSAKEERDKILAKWNNWRKSTKLKPINK